MKQFIKFIIALSVITAGVLFLRPGIAKASGADKPSKVCEVPDVPADKLLDAILAKYKGRPVLVDFWATWCGPCRAAMREMEPLKSDRLKGVSFVYITSATSPKDKWQNMIPDIHGDHYYITDEQLAVIYKQLETNAFPTYLVVGKDGGRLGTFIGYRGESMLKVIDEAAK